MNEASWGSAPKSFVYQPAIMYWPISGPRVYAASRSSNSKQGAIHDDEFIADNGSLSDVVDAAVNGKPANGVSSGSTLLPPRTPITPVTPGIEPVEHDVLQQATPAGSGEINDTSAGAGVQANNDPVIGLRMSRTGHLFAVITATSMTIWQTKPSAILATVVRTTTSLANYGPNIALLIRPDSAIFVVQTSKGYLITYSLASDPDARVYRPHFPDNSSVNVRRQSNFTGARNQGDRILWGPGEGGGVREVSIRFRMVIKVDAGISRALALDDELVVATQKPAAVQCIRWTPDKTGNQTSTELLRKMAWMPKDACIIEMVYDRPMNLSTWVTDSGEAFAVQRIVEQKQNKIPEPETDHSGKRTTSSRKLFRGYGFHIPKSTAAAARKAAINARFSLIAVGCADGSIHVYTAKDYAGNIPLCHHSKPLVSSTTTGLLTFLAYSPDGYCLFAGYEHGWAAWSVYGKPGSTSFLANRTISEMNDEGWLMGVRDGAWVGNGSEIMLIGTDDRIWVLEMARSAVTGCFAAANISKTMLQTTSSIMVYQGYDVPDMTSISAEASLWHVAQIPPSYLVDQWPMRCSVISSDGRYVAVAGRRGLAHYSVNSGRWKTFVNESMENEFQVRGGMCWHRHILVAAIEAGGAYGLQLYSREAALDSSLVLHSEQLPAPIVLIAPSGNDSLLVYTHENLLYHFIFTTSGKSVGLVQVGQIAFNGIVRSPARVRGLSWILPDEQIQEGDPSQDVAVATVLFLVDGKLVLLQPSLNEEQKLKYDMRVVANKVEYYLLTRDQVADPQLFQSTSIMPSANDGTSSAATSLRESLWMFDGSDMQVWTDVQEVLRSAPADLDRDLPATVAIQLDFYPLSVLLTKGILLGMEPDLVQRRDVNFAFFRFTIRVRIFL